MSKSFSWHSEFYMNALNRVSNTTGKQYFSEEQGEQDTGWLEWFEREYPEQFRKYDHALQQIDMLWGDMDPKAMEEFKKAVKVEMDATKWAVEKFIAAQYEKIQEEQMRGTQEALVL
ncbi:MAG: hypothetical protein AB1423_14355 [Pseudomonadota bacterium]